MYLVALTTAYFVIKARAAARGIAITKDQLYDLIVYAAVGVFVGGRLGYTLFYNFPYYIDHPAKIFAVWEGGMSFHGGLLGTVLAILLFCRRRGFHPYTIADLAALTVPIGLGLGRIGNFINGELYGRPTDVPWCMIFPGGGPECRHPSQFYEAVLEGGLLFIVIWLVGRRPTPPGTLMWTFITGYGLIRLVVEFFREPDFHLGFILGPFSMGQVLSLPMVLIGAFMLARGYQTASERRDHALGTRSKQRV
ncbi:MAG TPA: prolipoprotein diacylglyceryl transferase, partial [Nitrospiraceae bacterium]|nr:prolipoprotein diacylglyceryl transferase [Nitrospiraceae bacterium]